MTSFARVNAKRLFTKRENVQCRAAEGHVYVSVIAGLYEIRNAYHKCTFHSYDRPKLAEPLGVHSAGTIAENKVFMPPKP